jgi:hypothetical protein
MGMYFVEEGWLNLTSIWGSKIAAQGSSANKAAARILGEVLRDARRVKHL